MRDLLVSLLLLAFIKFILDEARQRRPLLRAIHCIFYIAVIIFAHFKTQYLSLPNIEALLNDVATLQNVALIVMLDLLLTVYITTNKKGSITNRLRNLFLGRVPMGTSTADTLPATPKSLIDHIRIAVRIAVLYLPSILFVPALFYLRLLLFYIFPGTSFTFVTVMLLVVVVSLTMSASYIVRPFLGNNYDTLCRASIFCAFILFITVVVAGALNPASQIRNNTTFLPNIYELCTLIGTVLIGCLIGYVISRIKKL